MLRRASDTEVDAIPLARHGAVDVRFGYIAWYTVHDGSGRELAATTRLGNLPRVIAQLRARVGAATEELSVCRQIGLALPAGRGEQSASAAPRLAA